MTGPAPEAAPPAKSDFYGVIGLCVRWRSDPQHVADAVVVVPSASPVLNQGTPQTIKGMSWSEPSNYDGRWVGVNLSIGGAPASGRPDCSALTG
jgi:hypothetical protein